MKYICFLFLALIIGGVGCIEDDPQPIREVITVRDTITILQRDTLIQFLPEDSALAVVLVRHAETVGSGSDRMLSDEGAERAMDLQRTLANLDLTHVYSTDFNRTQQTASPTAVDRSLDVISYNPSDLSGFAAMLKDAHKGQIVLVVGHSNTTPDLINVLTGNTSIPNFDEDIHDNLYIVNIKLNGDSDVYHLEYGEDSP